MDLTKYAPKKPLMPSLFSGITPSLKLPSLGAPAKPVTPMVTAPAPASAGGATGSWAAPAPKPPVVTKPSTSPAPAPAPAPIAPPAPARTADVTSSPAGSIDAQSLANFKAANPGLNFTAEDLQHFLSTGNGSTPGTTPAKPELSDTEKTVMSLMNPSSDELTTQADLDKITDSFKQGYQGIEDKAIPMQFITGEQASLEKRATNMAEPLEKKLARLQAQRTAALEASKFSLGRADKKVEAETDAKKTAFDQNYKTSTLEESKRKTDLDYKLSEEKFAEDKRQFGMEYALKARETAIKEKEAATKAGETTNAAAATQNGIASNLQLINDILKNPGAISGPFQSGSIPFTGGATTKNQYEQLKGALSLENRSKLKGSGAISDFEARTLEKAASDLGRNQSENDFTNSLKKLRGVFQTANGGEATVKITDPKSGTAQTVAATRAGINQAILDGLDVEYQ